MRFSLHDLGNTDIYLLDQIMKGRYKTTDAILDAGCGEGRNLPWFLLNNISIYGIDSNVASNAALKTRYPHLPGNTFLQAPLERMPFKDDYFNHIICSAVLHFAKSTDHFYGMISELVRVLTPGGSLFIRMTSNIGIEKKVGLISDGVYRIPDGSERFLLTRSLLKKIIRQHHLLFLEPLKTVNVNDERCMSTLVFQK